MECLIDTNILIDITSRNPDWMEWSYNALHESETRIINPIIYSEFCGGYSHHDIVSRVCSELKLFYYEIPKEALFFASAVYELYRSRGGTKTSPLPDFFIGAHAYVLDLPIMTRDTAKYKTYFPNVELISPEN